jgi:hypothetical protein
LNLLWEFHELYVFSAANYQQHPQSDVVVRPPPIWYHVTSICLSHISDEGVGAGSGPCSAMKTIGNCIISLNSRPTSRWMSIYCILCFNIIYDAVSDVTINVSCAVMMLQDFDGNSLLITGGVWKALQIQWN